jgi:methyl-accepting chemotaxis protein
MSLASKFRLTIATAVVGFSLLSYFWLSSERSHMLSAKREQARDAVELAYAVVAEQQEKEMAGKIGRSEAQERAVDTIRLMRYGDAEYFWINDMHPFMVMHPTQPQLDGQDLTDYRDSNGKLVFMQMVDTVRRNKAGYVAYNWPKPGSDRPVPKISYVKGFEPWGWIIGTGIYVGDVDSAWRSNALTAAGLGLACIAVVVFVSALTSRAIFHRLESYRSDVRVLTHGYLNLCERVGDRFADPDPQRQQSQLGNEPTSSSIERRDANKECSRANQGADTDDASSAKLSLHD